MKVETTANTGAAAASPSIETPISDRYEGGAMEATRSLTPPEVVFAPQVPFSWTLRGHAQSGCERSTSPLRSPTALPDRHGTQPDWLRPSRSATRTARHSQSIDRRCAPGPETGPHSARTSPRQSQHVTVTGALPVALGSPSAARAEPTPLLFAQFCLPTVQVAARVRIPYGPFSAAWESRFGLTMRFFRVRNAARGRAVLSRCGPANRHS